MIDRHRIPFADHLWGCNPDEKEILFPEKGFVDTKNEAKDE